MWFCPPPAPYGIGTVGGNASEGFPPNRWVGWYGPITVNCGTGAVAEITVETSGNYQIDPGNQNTYRGWTLMDSNGVQVPLDLHQTPTGFNGSGPVTACNPGNIPITPAAPRPFVPFQPGNVTETAVTLAPLVPGVDYWVHWGHASPSGGSPPMHKIESIDINCLVSA